MRCEVKSSLQKYLVGEFPILILTLSDATLNKLIKLMGSDNKFRELKWKEGDLHLDPYRKTEVSLITIDCYRYVNRLLSAIVTRF